MEVLAGARNEAHLHQLRGLLARATALTAGPMDYESAAALYRSCRQQGVTVRKLIDCLIAAIAIRESVSLLHFDSDFELLARFSTLFLHRP